MNKFIKATIKGIFYYAAFLAVHIVSFAFSGIIISLYYAAKFYMQYDVGQTGADLPSYLKESFANLSEYTVITVLISNIVAVLALICFFKYRKISFSENLYLNKYKISGAISAVLTAFGFTYGVSFLFNLIPFSESAVQEYVTQSSALTNGNPITCIIAVGIFAPIAEEMFFRGLIYTRLKQGMIPILAALISSFLFGASHGSFIWILNAMVAGLYLVWLFEKSSSLYPCIIFHSVNNILAFLNGYIKMSEKTEYCIIACSFVSLMIGVIAVLYSAKSQLKRIKG